MPFEEAREFVRTLNLKDYEDWRKFCKSGKRPEAIPASPGHVYKHKGWRGLKDWLGTKKR